jgi:hypothetical protein
MSGFSHVAALSLQGASDDALSIKAYVILLSMARSGHKEVLHLTQTYLLRRNRELQEFGGWCAKYLLSGHRLVFCRCFSAALPSCQDIAILSI